MPIDIRRAGRWVGRSLHARRGFIPWPIRKKGYRLFVEERIGVHLELLQATADALESLVHAIGKLQKIMFAAVDGAPVEHFAPIDHPIPIAAAINQDEVAALQLAGL